MHLWIENYVRHPSLTPTVVNGRMTGLQTCDPTKAGAWAGGCANAGYPQARTENPKFNANACLRLSIVAAAGAEFEASRK